VSFGADFPPLRRGVRAVRAVRGAGDPGAFARAAAAVAARRGVRLGWRDMMWRGVTHNRIAAHIASLRRPTDDDDDDDDDDNDDDDARDDDARADAVRARETR